MESFDGTPLEDHGSRRAFSRDSALNIISQIAEGLDAIHRNGAIVGTLRPSMILVNSNENVKILDASLAVPQSGLAAAGFSPEDILDAVPYVSPEVIRGEAVGTGSDQFSLALISCGLLTSNTLVDFRSPIEAMLEVGFGDLDGQVLHSLPLSLASPLRRALSSMPEARFGSCTEFSETLKHAARRRTSSATRLVDGGVHGPSSPVEAVPVPIDLTLAPAVASEDGERALSGGRRWVIAAMVSLAIGAAPFAYVWMSHRPRVSTPTAMQTAPVQNHDAELLRALKSSGEAAPATKPDDAASNADKSAKLSGPESSADAAAVKKADDQGSTAADTKKKVVPAAAAPPNPSKKKPADLDVKPIEPTVTDSH
jgi:serine/threonine protein kinase